MINAYAADEAGGQLKSFEYDPGELSIEDVEIKVEYCGLCHSDLSMLDNEWGMTQYPFVPGHEIVGTVSAVGSSVKNVTIGQKVGVGWFSKSCMTCPTCMSGDHNLCADVEGTIVNRHGGFADRVRVHSGWVTELPEGVNPESAGPLFCAGITVFNPIVQFDIKPTDHVGIIGVGGLGHMAIRFLSAWGCEVTVFSTNENKRADAMEMGASHFVISTDSDAIIENANSLDMVLSTVNQSLDWDAYITMLKPKGRLHLVGAVLDPINLSLFPMLLGQKSFSSSPLGSPSTIKDMLTFCARHQIEPTVDIFDIKDVNEAMQQLREGNAHYRIVLKI